MVKCTTKEIKYKFKAQDGRTKEGRLYDLIENKRAGQSSSVSHVDTGPAKGTMVIYRERILENGTKEPEPLMSRVEVELEDYERDLPEKVIKLCQALDLFLEEELFPSKNGVTAVEDKELLAFFEKERALVHTEIENIKTCRTSIFVRTLAILGAIGLAIFGLYCAETNSLPANSGASIEGRATILSWISFASVLPIFLLSITIYSLIHKARGLNERLGYLEAIEELKVSNSLEQMKGWILSSSIKRKCKIYHDAKNTGQQCPIKTDLTFCTLKSRRMSNEEINKYVKFWPDMLNSFTSFCTYVYGIAYLISVVIFLFSIVAISKYYCQEKVADGKISDRFFWGAVLTGIVVTALVVILSRTFKQKSDVPKKPKMQRVMKWLGQTSPVIIFLLIIGLITSLKFNNSNSAAWIAMVAYVVGGLISTAAAKLAFSSLEKVNSLRRGRHSIDRWRHTWKIRFEQCPMLNQ